MYGICSLRLRRKYPEITCSRCGFEGHNITGCGNVGVPTRPKKRKYGQAGNVTAEDDTSNVAEAATGPNEGQTEVELTASQPTTEPSSQPIGHAFAMGPSSQVTSHAVNSSEVFQVGFGQGTFDGGLIGVRPPPIRGPANMYHVPFPRGAASGNQGFMTFMPTPRGPPRGPPSVPPRGPN
ncbi:unnamed protein product [Trifolium pratense]|uniref:Uncharacterized protein n=1 Tax=Trifolium pratense TaxID=57577 RepID=A0ACB0JDJ1_TRIPR|nr:unnamed protein product [Trifolium pratense]